MSAWKRYPINSTLDLLSRVLHLFLIEMETLEHGIGKGNWIGTNSVTWIDLHRITWTRVMFLSKWHLFSCAL